VAGTEYCVRVDSTDRFRLGQIVRISGVVLAAGGTIDPNFRITSAPFTDTNKYIRVTPIETTASVDVDAGEGNEVLVVGSAHRQGATGSSEAGYELPVNIWNYLQIFRTSFSFTGSALKTPVKFDDTGAYKDKAKEATIQNSREMEFAFMFGSKSKSLDADNLPLYTMGGILWYMQQWEAGTTYGNTAATADTDDNKRIIVNATGKMSIDTYEDYLERLFRVTNSVTNEKLVLCGSGFLATVNKMYKGQTVFNSNLPSKDTFGMNVVSHLTPFGTVYYRSHPLFSQNTTMRYNALFLDVHNLVYRYLEGRDTQLYKDRQANDADHRKDEWLGECGLECRFPESHMYMQNVRQVIA
jgi:hypothetical protein